MNKKRSIKQDVFDIGASCVLGFEIVLCLFSVIQIGKCLIYHMLSVVVFGYHAYRAGILPDYLLGVWNWLRIFRGIWIEILTQ